MPPASVSATGGAGPPVILECTLRDGSYAVDFQFSPQDTALVARVLEDAGATLVEIGHGLGLGASHAGMGRAACGDAAYMEAAAQALERAAWGMFCIPGIARLEDIDLAASLGMGFVRVGVNPSRTAQAAPFLERAAQRGVFAFANLMKSYVLDAQGVEARSRELAGYGARAVYVVDSAGCMLPEAVALAVAAAAEGSGLPVGFHGHDNLRLAVANCLAARKAGAAWLDATLHGVGRGGGNAATEVLAAALESSGDPAGLNLDALLDAGRALFGELASGARGLRALDVTTGLAGLHSSFLPLADKAAREHGVDRRALIRSVAQIDRENPDAALFARQARALAVGPQGAPRPQGRLRLAHLPRTEREAEAAPPSSLADLGARVRSRARLTGRKAVMNIYAPLEPAAGVSLSPFVQEGGGYVIGSLRTDEASLPEVVAALDGVADVLFVDAERKPHQAQALYGLARGLARASRVIPYNDGDVWVRAVAAQLAWHGGGLAGLRVALLDASPLALRAALHLAGQGAVLVAGPVVAEVAFQVLGPACLAGPEIERAAGDAEACARARVLLAFERGRIDAEAVFAAPENALIMDGGIGALTREGLEVAQTRDLPVLRPDMRAMLAAELRAALRARRWLSGSGRSTLAGQPVVAGGLVGRRGDILLDSLVKPSQVIGVADGQGKALPDQAEFEPRLRLVRRAVLARKLSEQEDD